MYELDPYLSDERCTRRLYADYLIHKKLIVAVDFDNTIYDYHRKGNQFPQVINLLIECNTLNFPIIIYTANKDHQFIKKYCNELGINIEGINKNYLTEFGDSGKIYYNILLDDRAGLSSAYKQLKALIDGIKGEDK